MQKWFSDEHNQKYEKRYSHYNTSKKLTKAVFIIVWMLALVIVGYVIYLLLR
jgi:hypothetical protein